MTRELVVRCRVCDAARVGDALTAMGWGTLWIEEPLVQDTDSEGYVLHRPDPGAPAVVHAWPTNDAAAPAVPREVLGFAVALDTSRSDDVDWSEAWRAGHPSRIEIVPGWVLVPPWGAAEAGERSVVIEPGAAFGTGNHPTTRDSLRMLHERLRPGATVLDLGAGSGVLSIAAVHWGAGRVRAIDVDENAPAQIAANAALNGLPADRIEVARVDLVDALAAGGAWDIVLCNVGVAEILRALPFAASAVASGGYFIASGIFAPSRERVEQAAPQSFSLSDAREEDRWLTLAWRAEVR